MNSFQYLLVLRAFTTLHLMVFALPFIGFADLSVFLS